SSNTLLFHLYESGTILSNTRNFALFDRLFSSSSFSPGTIGFLVTTRPLETRPQVQTGKSGGQMQGRSQVRNIVLTILSSSEWKVLTQSRPPSPSSSTISSRWPLSTSSS